MRVLVDSKALEALCQAAEEKHRHLVNLVRTSIRSEPKTEAVTKVADYTAYSIAPVPDVEPVAVPPNYGVTPDSNSCTFAPRKRSAVSDK